MPLCKLIDLHSNKLRLKLSDCDTLRYACKYLHSNKLRLKLSCFPQLQFHCQHLHSNKLRLKHAKLMEKYGISKFTFQ